MFGAPEIEINAKMHAHTHADKRPIDISSQMKKVVSKKSKYRRKESQCMIERVESVKETETKSKKNGKPNDIDIILGNSSKPFG